MILLVPYMRGIFLTDLKIIIFSGGTLLHGIIEAKQTEDKNTKSRSEYGIGIFRDLNETLAFTPTDTIPLRTVTAHVSCP
jgi:hypothetical protein